LRLAIRAVVVHPSEVLAIRHWYAQSIL
jgi:hypothetical protein